MRYRFQSAGRIYEVELERQGSTYQASVDGQPVEFELLDSQPGQLTLRIDGRPLTIYWATDGSQKWFSLTGCAYHLEKPSARAARTASSSPGSESVRSPMPAQVRALQVDEGESVEQGQTLLLLEAMKMEIRIKAPTAGRVARLLVSEGQAVEKDQVLAEIAEQGA